jgi:hypothetical protein
MEAKQDVAIRFVACKPPVRLAVCVKDQGARTRVVVADAHPWARQQAIVYTAVSAAGMATGVTAHLVSHSLDLLIKRRWVGVAVRAKRI